MKTTIKEKVDWDCEMDKLGYIMCFKFDENYILYFLSGTNNYILIKNNKIIHLTRENMKKLKIIQLPQKVGDENYYKDCNVKVGDEFNNYVELNSVLKQLCWRVYFNDDSIYEGTSFIIPKDCCEEIEVPFNKIHRWETKEGEATQLELPLEEFRKNDEDKPQFSNLPQLALLDVVKAFDYGQKKYNKFNYSKGTEYLRYYDACQRHLSAWIRGEDIDESGNSHLSHSIASLMMLLDVINTGKGVDNRNKEYKINK